MSDDIYDEDGFEPRPTRKQRRLAASIMGRARTSAKSRTARENGWKSKGRPPLQPVWEWAGESSGYLIYKGLRAWTIEYWSWIRGEPDGWTAKVFFHPVRAPKEMNLDEIGESGETRGQELVRLASQPGKAQIISKGIPVR